MKRRWASWSAWRTPLGVDASAPPPLWFQALVTSFSLVDSWNLNVVWPLLPFQVASLGVADTEADIGLYVGVAASAFAVAQIASAFAWGVLADRVGRRPVLLLGMCGSSIAVLVYGTAKTYWQLVLGRALGGLLNGNSPVVKTYVGEITHKDFQPQVFGLFALTFGISSALAPATAGFLARPAELYPGTFKGTLFEDFPFLLPMLVTAFISSTIGLLGAFLVPETAAFADRQRLRAPASAKAGGGEDGDIECVALVGGTRTEGGGDAGAGVGDDEAGGEMAPPTSLGGVGGSGGSGEEETMRGTLVAGATYVLMSSVLSWYEELFPVFGKTSRSLGGLGLAQRTISAALCIGGVALVLYQTLVYPRLGKALGPTRTVKLASRVMILVAVLPPFASLPAVERYPAVFYPVVVLTQASKNCVAATFVSGTLIAVNNSCTSAVKARVNGAIQTVVSVARVVVPLACGAVLRSSLRMNEDWQQFVPFASLAVLVTAFACVASRLDPRLDAPMY